MADKSDNKFYGLEYLINGVPAGDILVQGRPLREFRPDEFTSYGDCMNFAESYFDAVSVGDDLDAIFGNEFREAFYAHRNSFVLQEARDDLREKMLLNTRSVLGANVLFDLIDVLSVAHMGWEMDNYYAVVRHAGVVKYIGTDHGAPRLYGRSHIEGLLTSAQDQVDDLRSALDAV